MTDNSIEKERIHLKNPGSPQPEMCLPPVFHSVEQERRHRKERLAGALRLFGKLGFSEGVAGHITVRDPEHSDMFWVNPLGVSFNRMRVSDLILVDHHGEVRYGDQPVNKAAFAIHSAIHRSRPDVVSAAHAHSVYGKILSSLHASFRYLTQDACSFYDDVDFIRDSGGRVIFDTATGVAFAAAFTKRAAIHANHGLFTTGLSVDEAAFWFITLERSCQVQVMAQAAGDPVDIEPGWAEESYRINGSSYAGWLSFQPLWQDLVATQPDFLD
jgi:ribulose-5-phosphate 4-epimerase/fuculose-1-phosphate aldolase